MNFIISTKVWINNNIFSTINLFFTNSPYIAKNMYEISSIFDDVNF